MVEGGGLKLDGFVHLLKVDRTRLQLKIHSRGSRI
jgi:hypothetical protein